MIRFLALLPTKYAIIEAREKQHSGKIYSMKVFLNSKFKNDSWPQLDEFFLQQPFYEKQKFKSSRESFDQVKQHCVYVDGYGVLSMPLSYLPVYGV